MPYSNGVCFDTLDWLDDLDWNNLCVKSQCNIDIGNLNNTKISSIVTWWKAQAVKKLIKKGAISSIATSEEHHPMSFYKSPSTWKSFPKGIRTICDFRVDKKRPGTVPTFRSYLNHKRFDSRYVNTPFQSAILHFVRGQSDMHVRGKAQAGVLQRQRGLGWKDILFRMVFFISICIWIERK